MNIRRLIAWGWFILASVWTANAQQSVCWEDFAEWMSTINGDDEDANEELYNELYELHSHPLNLNNMTCEQLKVLPFLSENQIKDIMAYIELNRPLASTGELMAIESVDAVTRSFLQLFCYAGSVPQNKPTFRDWIVHSDNEAVIRTDFPFYTKAAYADYPSDILAQSPNKVYRGNRLYHSLRYSFNSMDRIEAGFQMEKDAGERGADYLAGYALIRNTGILHSAVVGDYRISFGQGLVVNTSSAFGKTMMLGNMGRLDRGISRHSSMSESGYFRGAAAALRYRNFRFTAFASWRDADATMLNDSSGISSLKTDGLHRTPLEYGKKGNTKVTDLGGNIRFAYNAFEISATAAATHYSLPLKPQSHTLSSLYRLYNAHGTDFSAYSIAYAYLAGRVSARGETAISSEGGAATINSIQFAAGDYNNLTLIQRYYSARYVAVNAKSFGNNSSPQNESGIFLGWNTSMLKRTKIEAYVDIAYFPWMKYKAYGSSYSTEGMWQVAYMPRKNLSFSLRHRIKARQQNYKTDEGTSLHYLTTNNIRLQCLYGPSKRITLRTTVVVVTSHFISDGIEKGFLFSENVRWHFRKGNGKSDFCIAYFNTDSYASRIYCYEPSLLYVYGFQSFFYHGVRASLLTVLPLRKGLSFTAKLGHTRFFNRSSIGSGTELIEASHREDLQVQLRWKF